MRRAAGPAGTALAYAQVSDGGRSSLVSARTSGFGSVTRLAASTSAWRSTPGWSAGVRGRKPHAAKRGEHRVGNTVTQTDQLIVEPRGANALCPEATVRGSRRRNGVAADDVSFTLIVP